VESYLRDILTRKLESKLTAEESEKLEKYLVEKTYLKMKNIFAHVKEKFNKKYSQSGMTAC